MYTQYCECAPELLTHVPGAMPLFNLPPYHLNVRMPPKPIQPQGNRGAREKSWAQRLLD